MSFYLLGGWLPEGYYRSSPFDNFTRKEQASYDTFDTVLATLSEGAQGYISQLLKHYGEQFDLAGIPDDEIEEKLNEIKQAVVQAYKGTLHFAPTVISRKDIERLNINFWRSLDTYLKVIDTQLESELPLDQQRRIAANKRINESRRVPVARQGVAWRSLEKVRSMLRDNPRDFFPWLLAYERQLPFNWRAAGKRGTTRRYFSYGSPYLIPRGKNSDFKGIWKMYFKEFFPPAEPKGRTAYPEGVDPRIKTLVKRFVELFPPYSVIFSQDKRNHLMTLMRLYTLAGITNADEYEQMRSEVIGDILAMDKQTLDNFFMGGINQEKLFSLVIKWAQENGLSERDFYAERADFSREN